MNDKWRLGHTKVFFRAGSMGILEEVRDECIKNIIKYLQGIGRGYCNRKLYKIEIAKRQYIPIMQRNFKKFMFFRDWSWYYLTNHTKRFIGQTNIEDEIIALEEEAAEACAQYDTELVARDKFREQNEQMTQEKKDMMTQIEAEQGDLSSYQKDLADATVSKQEKDDGLAQIQKRLQDAENKRNELAEKKRKYEGDLGSFRKDIDDMEMAIGRAEQEKTNRDHTIRNMNDEIAHQDELINKLNKEKKYMQENQAKSSEELGAAEEKLDHLGKIKAKLEVTLDELEASLEREKKSRLDMDKQRRKIDAELKVTQEQVTDLEKGKKDIEANISKKEKDISEAQHKLEDEQNLVGKLQKTIKELQSRIEANEEELEAERQARSKAEKQRGTLARELDDLGERLEEAGGATSAQVELNKKREAEIGKLRRDLEESVIQHESILAGLKKKHLDAIAEMSEQIDQLNKMKAKIEKEKHGKRLQIDEMSGGMDTVANEKASAEKQNRLITQQLSDVTRRCEEAKLTLSDFDNAKKKILLENADLLHNIEELDNNNSVLAKLRQTLGNQLEEQRRIADEESK